MAVRDPHHDLADALIVSDAIAFRRIFSRRDPGRSLLFVPHVSMFATESLAYFQEQGTAVGSFGEHAGAIERSRHSLKFLDDSARVPRAMLDQYAKFVDTHHRVFLESHTGILGPLKRLLQPDLGISVLEGNIVGITHLMSLQLGTGDEELATMTLESIGGPGMAVFDRSRALSGYIALVLDRFGAAEVHRVEELQVSPILCANVDAGRFYGSLLRQRTPRALGTAMLLTAALCAANVGLHIVPESAQPNEPLATLFQSKWRLVALFHVASSLRHIVAMREARDWLRDEVHRELVALRRRLEPVLRFKKLRNRMVHYRPHRSVPVSPAPSVRALLQDLANGPIKAVDAQVDQGLQDVSRVLGALHPRVTGTLMTPVLPRRSTSDNAGAP